MASVAFAQEVFYLNSESFGTYSRSIVEKLVENRTDEKVAKAIHVGALINGDAKMFSPGTKVKVLERDPQNFWAKSPIARSR
jgi:hypothetical protein